MGASVLNCLFTELADGGGTEAGERVTGGTGCVARPSQSMDALELQHWRR